MDAATDSVDTGGRAAKRRCPRPTRAGFTAADAAVAAGALAVERFGTTEARHLGAPPPGKPVPAAAAAPAFVLRRGVLPAGLLQVSHTAASSIAATVCHVLSSDACSTSRQT